MDSLTPARSKLASPTTGFSARACPPGYGRGLQCLLNNAGALSPACRSALEGHELLTPDGEGQDWDK